MAAPMITLASSSPRRAELLRAAGFQLRIQSSDIDEAREPDEVAEAYVMRLARTKAAASKTSSGLVLGADTVVVIHGEILGKPRHESDAESMLSRLSGQWHEVLTGVAVINGDRAASDLERTRVKFAELSLDEVRWYIDTGEAFDKAGAYAIQGRGALFIERIEGSYSNVVGLPLRLVYRLAREVGVDLVRA
jgi:nucleoside triphosphate pyrophosphatase